MPDRDAVGRWFVGHAVRHRLSWPLWLLGLVSGTILAVLLPILLGRAFDQVRTAGRAALPALTLALLGSQLARALAGMVRVAAAARLAGDVEFDVRDEAFVSVAGKSALWHSAHRTGEVLARLVNDVRQARVLIYPAGDALASSWGFIAIDLVVAPAYGWPLLLAPSLYLVGYVLISYRMMRRLAAATDRVRAEFGALNSEAGELLEGLVTVRTSGLGPSRLRRFAQAARGSRDATVAQGAVEARAPLFLLLGVVQAIGFGHALWLALDHRLTPGSVVGYVGLLLMLGLPTFSALAAYPLAREGVSALRRVRRVIVDPDTEPDPEGGYRAPVQGAVDLVDVCFRYPHGRLALDHVTVSFAPATVVAVLGATGSGKSTLAGVLTGSLPATAGRVLLDGVDVARWSRAALRAAVAVVPENVVVFRDTVEGNVAMGRAATPRRVHAAIEAAGADEFVGALPEGISTRLGAPDGMALSGGQRQRVGLARALLASPRVLVLDDCTSALDSVTEQRVCRDLIDAVAGATIVMITSRPRLVRFADTVVVLRAGRVVAQGPVADLANHPDEYVRVFLESAD